MGWDGRQGTANDRVARDAFGYSLNYYNGDYQLVGGGGLVGSGPWMGGNMHNLTDAEGKTTAAPLYNGNISSMAVSLPAVGTSQLYAYRYDQLNRITRMDAFGGMVDGANTFWPQAGQGYKERVSYDANGNILKYLRHGSAAQNLHMDSLTYKYKTGTNQLRQVRDAVAELNYKEDIDDQPDVDNYVYDAIGNLIADKKDSISLIKWNVYGKIAEIQRVASTARPVSNIKYYYDAGGNRIGKRVERMAGTVEAHPVEYTWYVRDASGNTMAVYAGSGTGTVNGGHSLQLTEQHIYGSSRLGLLNRTVDMKPLFVNPAIVTFTRGNKFFELSNHLGNVLATVSDRKLQAGGGTVGQWQGYYEAEVITANDYYPFGMMMPGRKFSLGGRYRFGFNGKEKDNELEGQQDYGFRIYDNRLGRFKSVDPLTAKYPAWSPYAFAMNSPIGGIDLDGLEFYYAADGKFLGQGGDSKNTEVRLARSGGKTKSGNDIFIAVDKNGKDASSWTVIHKDINEFKKILGTIYNESSASNQIPNGQYDWKEAAGIYDVMENRAPFFTGSVESSWFAKSGIYGLNKASSLAVRNYNYDNKGMDFKDDNGRPDRLDLNKLQITTQGVIAGMINQNSILDYSGGGTTWHGKDFSYPYKGTSAYSDYYKTGFQFTNPSHDIWKLGSFENKRTLTGVVNKEKVELSYLYKYTSTGAAGGSTFMKRTLEGFGEGYPAVKQALLQGDRTKAQSIVSGLKGQAAY